MSKDLHDLYVWFQQYDWLKRREATFLKFLRLCLATKNSVIVEIGSIRNDAEKNRSWDGHSTLILADYIRDFWWELWTVDIRRTSYEATKRVLGENRKNVHIFHEDGIEFLKTFTKKIDALYLDADLNPEQTFQIYNSGKHLLKRSSIIMIDDCNISDKNTKGELLLPYLLDHGWEKVMHEHQVILRRRKKNFWPLLKNKNSTLH